MYHKDLNVWKESMSLVTGIYQIVSSFPKYEDFALSSQMRRAAVSIPSNIAEGCARGSNKEMIRFCYISLGSLSELDTQICIANNLGYINDTTVIDEEIKKVRKLLSGFINYLQTNINRSEGCEQQ